MNVSRHSTALGIWDTAVAAAPEAPCVYWFDTHLSYGAIERAATALAVAFRKDGVGATDRVGILLQNDPQWLVALIAAWKVGAIAVPVSPMLRERELAHQLADSGARVLVVLPELLPTVRAAIGATDVQRVIPSAIDDGNALLFPEGAPTRSNAHDTLMDLVQRHLDEPLDCHEPAPGDVAVLTYTSGTTGPSKGAMNTHANIAYNTERARAWFELDSNDVLLGIAPLFHVTGLVLHMALSWSAGAPLVLFHRFDGPTCLRLAERWGATFTVGASTAFVALIQEPELATRDLSRLRKVASGGAPVTPALISRFEGLTGAYIHNVYGLTETTSPSHMTPLGVRGPVDAASGWLSVGVSVPGTVTCIVDPATRAEMPAGEPGEIVIEGPMVVPGYWDKPEETERAMPNGVLHTGDIGFTDENGWLFVIDRLKDQINTSGFKVWPREVEDVLCTHEAVFEAAVVGEPDPYRGETVAAFVSVRPDATVDEATLMSHCRGHLAAYKCPRTIRFVKQLPKTASGKVLRRELRAQSGRDSS